MERIGKTILHRYSKNMGKYASLLDNGNPNKIKSDNERVIKEPIPLEIMDLSEITNSRLAFLRTSTNNQGKRLFNMLFGG